MIYEVTIHPAMRRIYELWEINESFDARPLAGANQKYFVKTECFS